MSSVEAFLPVVPERAFSLLARPQTYASWVVGASEIPSHDPDWPAPGTLFEHEQGIGPLTLRDTTSVLESVPPGRLVLEARVRPFLVARIEFTLTAEGGGTRLRMQELPVGGWLAPVADTSVARQLIRLRNEETLRRLGALAEEEAKERGRPAR